MTDVEKQEIVIISKKFAEPFKDTVGDIADSGWLIVDPLSAYLNACGYKNTLSEIPKDIDRPQILVISFDDGTQLIPAGSRIPVEGTYDWLWID